MVDELEPGAYVTPSVRLVCPLAQGGMGKVWIAEHLVLETDVVVKLMAPELSGSAEAAGRFAREAAVAAAVKSPHVVQVFDSGVTEAGIAYIVMELLEGHDLGAHITARGRMRPAEVASVLTQLGKALAKAHRVGVVHRDIKPENVFLCDHEGGEPFVKLLDFGTAKDELRTQRYATTAGQLLGTPYYMSPEQILGEEVDARSDIWSLGVVAFEAITGTRPFEGATVGGITLAIHTTQPRMTDVLPELPAALDAWFSRACALDPGDRFQTAKAATDAFARAIASMPESVADLTSELPSAQVAAARGGGRGATPSDRVATSLSSTLAPPRAEHRAMKWIAGAVAVATLGAMLALVTHEEPRAASAAAPPTVAPPAPAPPPPPPSAVAAPAPAPPPPPPSAIAAPPAPPAPTVPAPPAPEPALSASAARPALPLPPLPFPAASARVEPRASASTPPHPRAPALAPAPASPSEPAPASPSEPAPDPDLTPPPPDPLPPPPIDIHDIPTPQ